MELYFQAWKRFLTFDGIAKRSEYWAFVLINVVISFLLSFISPEIGAIFGLLTIIPHISVSVRRLHDINLSGWWAILFIPTAFPMLIVGFIDSKEKKENNEDTKRTLAKAVINHSKELVQEVKPTINNYIEKYNKIDEIVVKDNFKIENNLFEDINEDEIYEQVMIEIEENNKIKSTWAKALSLSDGDDKKAQSLYIKLRVDTLTQEKKEQIELEKKKIQQQEFILKQEQEKLEEQKFKEERIIQEEQERLKQKKLEEEREILLKKALKRNQKIDKVMKKGFITIFICLITFITYEIITNEYSIDKQLKKAAKYSLKKNYKEAFKWYEKAANQGNSDSQYELGKLYYSGLGVEQNYKKAFQWFEKSANQGNSNSQYELGKLYRNGEGIEMNKYKAFELLLKSYQKDNTLIVQKELNDLCQESSWACKNY